MTPYIGEIRMFAGSFAPVGWEFCNGQVLPISENETLFQLIGTIYGGDGQQTFALPNLQSRVPIHRGTSPASMITRQIGTTDGAESVTINPNQVPIHTHVMLANTQTVTTELPTNAVLASSPSVDTFGSAIALTPLASDVISLMGGSQAHENMMPFLTISFIISMYGVFPSET